MKNNKKEMLLSMTAVFMTSLGFAQTVNTGELFIASGTLMNSMQEVNNTATGEIVNDGDLYLYSHYNNDGLVDFSPEVTTGITRMRGTSGFQNISGSVPMMLNNIEFNNNNIQPAFHLSNEIRISGQAAFENGVVDNEEYEGLVVFEPNATHIKVRNESHVDGLVQKNGKSAFTYPIGDGGYYRHARISAPQKNEDAFTGKYYLKNSDFEYSHNSKDDKISIINNAEYWTLDKTAGNDNVFLTLSWNEDTTPFEIYGAPYDEIHIVHWDESKRKWIDLGGAANSASKEVSMVVDPLQSYGIFTLARVKAELSDLVIYNAVSPNGDGMNDYFKIDGIKNYQNNTVEIYNRWGVKVFETKAYDTTGNTFQGYSEGRVTINKDKKLPVGTYFYIINVQDYKEGKDFKKSGYLYISY
ncbi:gliding motility-associated C-terminal domain-containing protein [Flavobacterium resistens]|uniref:Gliding motility-associated C-terminal domain-containing protein n=1 Tax=Flavobacterium resistens TaxID=443612 RepID=A0A521EZ86_9FLAO|nr:gliding motility-associated C-terminal domain-containing protein [Flavobacterium resistens]MRX69318.1 T9SS type B sorting domain-containing protein [Flavobacterium resistens]SMO89219.1 gliding motility-associated C-terminal domain-containing protein [Flavobacterium resistens]